MSNRKLQKTTNFGRRLAALRKAAGYTQLELSNEIGISRRMVAYYEGQSQNPPAKILPTIAKALGITVDELLGVTRITVKTTVKNSRLHRRLQQIEQLQPKEKRQILQLIDTFIERDQLKKKAFSS